MMAAVQEDMGDAPLTLRIKTRLPGSGSNAGIDTKNTNAEFSLDIDLTLPNHGIAAIFGESGSGKTTLLRCIAGLQAIDEGLIQINGETWHDTSISKSAHQRSVGYVFQEASLFQHLTVNGNLNYALRRADRNHNDIGRQQVIEMMDIRPLLARKPSQLSGGERQRVAIARALLINPQVLLMDEPLAALDGRRRQEILPYLERLHQECAMPVFYVTHSLQEVARLADYLILLEGGKVAAQGSLVEMLSRTDLSIGGEEEAGTVLQGEIVCHDKCWHLVTVAFPGGELQVRDSQGLGEIGKIVRIRVLARDISLSLDAQQQSSILNRLAAKITSIETGCDPALAVVQLRVGDTLLLARISQRSVADLNLAVGQTVWAQIKSVAILR